MTLTKGFRRVILVEGKADVLVEHLRMKVGVRFQATCGAKVSNWTAVAVDAESRTPFHFGQELIPPILKLRNTHD